MEDTNTPEQEAQEPLQQDSSIQASMRERLERDAAMNTARQTKKERDSALERAENIISFIQEDPIAAYEEAGLDINDLREKLGSLDDNKSSTVEEKLAALQEELMNLKKEKVDLEYTRQETDVTANIREFLQNHEDDFPVLSAQEDGPRQVYDLIVKTYNEDKQLLSESEASSMIEDKFRSQYEMLSSRYGNRYGASVTSPTLTNRLAGQAGPKLLQPNPKASSAEVDTRFLEIARTFMKDM